MEKMTIHRALAELKLIDSKIEKAIHEINPVGITQKTGKVNMLTERAEFEKAAKANLQSITDNIKRKGLIKSAIVQANAVTIVKIGNVKMTIADAINTKAIIIFKNLLINELEDSLTENKNRMAANNLKVEENAIKLAEAALGKDNVKINEGDVQSIIGPYKENNLFDLVDPLKSDDLIASMKLEVSEFEMEVDAALSEINAITIIEVK